MWGKSQLATNKLKKETGIVLCVVFWLVFLRLALLLGSYFDGAYWYCVSSAQRLVFFVIELWIFVKLFKKDSVREVLHLHNFKEGVICGFGVIVYIVFYLITYCLIGAKSWISTTLPIILSCLFLQQFTTGLWEELTFRAFLCEGYYQGTKRTAGRRLLYAGLSFFVFGLAHAIESSSLNQAIYRFFITGVWGFTFAMVYLHTHNILASAFLHFFSDIFLNLNGFIAEWNDSQALTVLDNYVNFIILGGILVTGIVVLFREPLKDKTE